MTPKYYLKTRLYFSMIFLLFFMVALCGCSSSGGSPDPGGGPTGDDPVETPGNDPPVARFSLNQMMGTTQTVFLLDASASSDSDGSIVSYAWAFGDGQTSTDTSVSHSYSTDGTYAVVLTVTDDDGASSELKQDLVISSSGTMVDDTGGTVISDDGHVSLTLPPGAISGIVGISISKTAQTPSGAVSDSAYVIEPLGMNLDHPMTLTIFYDPDVLPDGPDFDEMDLWIGQITGAGPKNWTPVSGSHVDPITHSVSADVDAFSSCGVVSGYIFSEIATTVYVVDTIESGHTDQFLELDTALAYLNTHLTDYQSGTIIIRTHQTLTVTELVFEKNIRIEMAEGYHGHIEGPGIQPLLISAAGALGLSGLPIVNSGGITVAAASDVIISSVSFPATAVTVGGSSSKGADGTGVSGNLWSVTDSIFLGPFQFLALNTLKGKLSLINLDGPSLDLQNTSYASVKATVSKNIVNDLNFSFMLGSDALVQVQNHANLNNMNLDFDLLSQTDMDIRSNTVASASLTFKGQGLATIYGKANNYGTSTWNIGTTGTTVITSEDETTGKDGQNTSYTLLEGTMMFNQSAFTAKGTVQYVVEDAATMTLKMLTTATYQGDFLFTLRGNLNLELSDTTSIDGFAELLASGSFLNMKTMGARFKSGVQLNAENVSVSADVQLGGGVESVIDGPFDLNPPGQGTCNFNANDVRFMLGLQISHDLLSGGKNAMVPRSKAGDSVFMLSGITVAEGNGGILFNRIDQGSITIEESEIHGLGGIGLFMVDVPVTIQKNTLTNNGIMVAQCGASVNVTENSITTNGAGMGIWATESGNVTVNNNTLIDGSGGACAIYAMGNQRIIANGNSEISGKIIAAGDAVIGLTGNTFSNASIIDGNQNGGFINDPVNEGNSGMDPHDIDSLVDWDGNGCADYPPEHNEKDGDENCEVDGVSPPS